MDDDLTLAVALLSMILLTDDTDEKSQEKTLKYGIATECK